MYSGYVPMIDISLPTIVNMTLIIAGNSLAKAISHCNTVFRWSQLYTASYFQIIMSHIEAISMNFCIIFVVISSSFPTISRSLVVYFTFSPNVYLKFMYLYI